MPTTTVAEIINRVQPILDKRFRDASLTTINSADGLRWIADSYWKISRLLKVPRVTDDITVVAGTSVYDIPDDCLGFFRGIISLEDDTTSNPYARINILQLKEIYGKEWKNPSILRDDWFYTVGPSDTEIRIVPVPTKDGKLNIEYVQRIAPPATVADEIPPCMVEFIPDIPLYVLGRAMEADRQGRGAAMIGEFESRILRTARLQKREPGPTAARENRWSKLKDYHNRFIWKRRV